MNKKNRVYGVKLGETGQLTESKKRWIFSAESQIVVGEITVFTIGGKTTKCTTLTWSAQHHSGGSV